MNTPQSPDSYAEVADEMHVDTVKAIAQAIRDAADDFERNALRTTRSAGDEQGPRVNAAVRAIHSLHWGIANASIERVVRDAAEADRAERELTR